jgi:ACT domain-containing protein
LSLVHIPLHQYAYYVRPLIQLLLPEEGTLKDIPFINISVNPIEASVICPKDLAEKFFLPIISPSTPASRSEDSITIAPDDYILMFVTGAGSQPSQRVIDLTTPLALAGISIFFITTYFSDYIICPRRSRSAVIAALEARGFELTHSSGDAAYPHSSVNYAHRPPTASSDGSGSHFLAPGTPPPSTLSDLQIRTFGTLKKRAIAPAVDRHIRLVHCAGKDGPIQEQQALLLTLIRCLVAQPKFFSMTIAEEEAPSILIEQSLLPLFVSPMHANNNGHSNSGTSTSASSLLLGTTSEKLVPIVLDLRSLPLESTGIVCGVAGRLVELTKRQLPGPVEMSYLSTAQAGAVIVSVEDLDRTIEVLEEGQREERD